MLAGGLFVVGIAVLVVWAIGAGVGRPDEDEAIGLPGRFNDSPLMTHQKDSIRMGRCIIDKTEGAP
jgi:hypothetical protein